MPAKWLGHAWLRDFQQLFLSSVWKWGQVYKQCSQLTGEQHLLCHNAPHVHWCSGLKEKKKSWLTILFTRNYWLVYWQVMGCVFLCLWVNKQCLFWALMGFWAFWDHPWKPASTQLVEHRPAVVLGEPSQSTDSLSGNLEPSLLSGIAWIWFLHCTLGLSLFCRLRGTFAISFLEKAASWDHQSPEWSAVWGTDGRGSTSC